MTGRCSWCGRQRDDLVERPVVDDHGPVQLWCPDKKACQAAKESVRTVSRVRIPRGR